MEGRSPPGTAPHQPGGTRPHSACKPRGQCRAPTPAHPRPQHMGSGPRQPAQRVGSRGGGGGWPETPITAAQGNPPRGRPSATPATRNDSSQGRTLWGRCWVPRPTPTAPGTHGSWNPGCPPQRTGGRERDSAWHNTPLTRVGGRPPWGRPPTSPATRSPHRAGKPGGQCRAPTAAHPRPQHVGSGPRQPTQRAGSRGRGGAWHNTPLTRVGGHPPRGRPPTSPATRSPHRAGKPGGQCRAPTAAHPRAQHVGSGPRQPAQRAGSRGRGSAWPQTPSQRRKAPTPGTAPTNPAARSLPRGMRAKGTVLGPHTRTPAPTTRREGGKPEEGKRQNTDAPDNGERQPPPRGRPSTAPTVRSNSSRGHHAVWPVLGPPPSPRHAAPTGRASQRDSVGPRHPLTRAHNTLVDPTARREGGQPGVVERLASEPPLNRARRPPRGRPSATPATRHDSSQGHTLWGQCWVRTPTPTAPGTYESRNPGCPPQRTGGRGRDSA